MLGASIVVCTRNRAGRLPECLGALADQVGAGDHEVVVVDNGSADGTDGAGSSLGRRRSRAAAPPARARRRPVPGPQPRRGRGARDVVLFIDDDALAPRAGWPPTWPRTPRPRGRGRRRSVALRWPDGRPGWLAPGSSTGTARSTTATTPWPPGPPPHGPYGTNMSVRRTTLDEVGGFDTRLGRRGRSLVSSEEGDLFSRVWAAGGTLAYEPAALVLHGVTPDRLSRRWVLRRGWAQGRSNARRQWAAAGEQARWLACAGRRQARRSGTSARSHGRRRAATRRVSSTTWPGVPAIWPLRSSWSGCRRKTNVRRRTATGGQRRSGWVNEAGPGRRPRGRQGEQGGISAGCRPRDDVHGGRGHPQREGRGGHLGTRSLEIPSVVLLRSDGEMLIGEAAERRSQTEPDRFAREFKRRMGDPTPVLLGGSPFSAHALTARLLRGGGQGGGRPRGWRTRPHRGHLPRQLGRLQARPARAGGPAGRRRAGQHRHRARGGRRPLRADHPGGPGEIVAVYDLGGGTFDAAVLRNTGPGLRAARRSARASSSSAASTSTRPCSPGWSTTWPRRSPSSTPTTRGRWRRCAAAARLRRGQGVAVVGHRHGHPGGAAQPAHRGAPHPRRVRGHDPAHAGRHARRHARRSTRRGAARAAVKSVLLVGGSSRIPLVGQMLVADLQRPVAIDVHPKHAVALGAAHLAAAAGAIALAAEAPVHDARAAGGDPLGPTVTGHARARDGGGRGRRRRPRRRRSPTGPRRAGTTITPGHRRGSAWGPDGARLPRRARTATPGLPPRPVRRGRAGRRRRNPLVLAAAAVAAVVAIGAVAAVFALGGGRRPRGRPTPPPTRPPDPDHRWDGEAVAVELPPDIPRGDPLATSTHRLHPGRRHVLERGWSRPTARTRGRSPARTRTRPACP